MGNKGSAVIGATLMFAFIAFLYLAYESGLRAGRREVYEEANQHGKGQYSIVGDPTTKFQWFKD